MTYYMYLIQTFIIRCTISEMLAKIDHKGPLDFSDLENDLSSDSITFIRARLVSQQRSYIMQ